MYANFSKDQTAIVEEVKVALCGIGFHYSLSTGDYRNDTTGEIVNIDPVPESHGGSWSIGWVETQLRPETLLILDEASTHRLR